MGMYEGQCVARTPMSSVQVRSYCASVSVSVILTHIHTSRDFACHHRRPMIPTLFLQCIVVSDACASFFDDFHETALRMISAQGGIFGSVSSSRDIVQALSMV